MKRKLLMAALYAVSALGFHANAQKDVTYLLTNADFSQGIPTDNHICGYGYDMDTNETNYYGLQDVVGWSKSVVKGDNAKDENKGSVVTWTNSAMAGGVFAYGSEWQLKGGNVGAPATAKDGSTGNCLGFLAVWSNGGYYYQDVELPAGKYTMTVPAYNQKGSRDITSYTGFIPESGEKQVQSVKISIGEWTDIVVNFELQEKTKGQIALGYVSANIGSSDNPNLFFDKITLSSDANPEDIYNVVLDAAKAIDAEQPMNAAVKSSLEIALTQYGEVDTDYETAIEALSSAANAAKISIEYYKEYDKVIKPIHDAAATLDEAGKAAYEANETVAEIKKAYSDNTLKDFTSEYKKACTEALQAAVRVQDVGADMTLAIANPDFEAGRFAGWTNNGMKVQDNGESIKVGSYYAEVYQPDGTKGISQKVANIPIGKYKLSARVIARGVTSAKIFAEGVETPITIVDSYGEYNVEFSVDTDKEITIGFEGVGTKANSSWMAVDNFTLTLVERETKATEEDYAALNAAIVAAESHALGFEAGEYAPYNNVEAVALLASAKALNQKADNAKEYIEALTQALNDAKWSEANTEEVNAIYDGSFKECAEDTTSPLDYTPAGWTPTGSMRQMLKNGSKTTNNGVEVEYRGVEELEDGVGALFMNTGTITYGEQAGYEIPLKDAYYKLQFNAASWNGEDKATIKVSIVNGENGIKDESLGIANKYVGTSTTMSPVGLETFELIFRTGAAGNYVFSVNADRNLVVSGFELKKVTDVSVEVSPAGYATFSSELPLDLSAIEGGTAYIVADDAEGECIKLTEQTEAVPANTGLIIAGEGTVTIPVVATANPLDKDNYLVAVNKNTTVESGYVLGWDGSDPTTVGFYVVDKTPAPVKAGQAYLELPTSEEEETAGIKVLRFTFGDGTATAIETAEAADADADGAIYNVAGQQVGKDYKGIVIKNGKKYLNK